MPKTDQQMPLRRSKATCGDRTMSGQRKMSEPQTYESVGKDSRSVLLVMPHEPHQLIRVLHSMGLAVLRVESCRQARHSMQMRPSPRLIVTEVSLADGNWCGVLTLAVKLGLGSPVILSCGSADERLWSEALWRGVYDVLTEPYEADQVRWVVEGALRVSPRLAESDARGGHKMPEEAPGAMHSGESEIELFGSSQYSKTF